MSSPGIRQSGEEMGFPCSPQSLLNLETENTQLLIKLTNEILFKGKESH